MEGHIYNKTMIHSKQEGFARSVSQDRKHANGRSKRKKAEILWTSGGAALIGFSVYLLSFAIL